MCSQAKSDDPIEVTFSVDSSCDVVSLEHVVVRMTLSITVQSGGTYSYSDYFDDPDVMYHDGAKRGDISVEIYSPQGTRLAPSPLVCVCPIDYRTVVTLFIGS